MEKAALGLDIGTSACKVSVYSLDQKQIIRNQNVKYPEPEIKTGVSRLTKYTDTVVAIINDLGESYEIVSVAFSTQMYSFVVDGGEKLVYQWNVPWKKDREAERIVAQYTNRSGCPVDTLFPAYKILSAKGRHLDLAIRPYGLQEAIVKHLTGVLAGDYCNLSSTGFVDVRTRQWNEELLEEAGFQRTDMPKFFTYNEPVGVITNPAVKNGKNITVACGLGDGPSASYASKDVSNMAANIGTSMAVRGFLNNIDSVDFKRVWTFVVDENTWVSGGISSNGSSVLDHYRQTGLLKDWELNTTSADNEIYYFPWKNGERTPYWSSKLKETMIGGRMDHTQNDYMCAMFRGIAYTIATMYSKVDTLVGENDLLCAAGGGVNSEILMHYLAGTMKVKLGVLKDFDYLGSYGAAYVAAEAVGEHPDRNQNLVKIYIPTQEYEDNYRRWLSYGEDLSALYENREE